MEITILSSLNVKVHKCSCDDSIKKKIEEGSTFSKTWRVKFCSAPQIHLRSVHPSINSYRCMFVSVWNLSCSERLHMNRYWILLKSSLLKELTLHRYLHSSFNSLSSNFMANIFLHISRAYFNEKWKHTSSACAKFNVFHLWCFLKHLRFPKVNFSHLLLATISFLMFSKGL